MSVRWSPVESNPLEQYLALLGLMPGQNVQAPVGPNRVQPPATGGDDHFATAADLPPEVREWMESALHGPGSENTPPELRQLLQLINQGGLGPEAPGRTTGAFDPKNPLANMSLEEMLQLLIDYFANEMHQREQQRAAPPRNAGNMGGQQWSGTRPASWPSSGGGGSSRGGGGGGPGGEFRSRTNGAGLPNPGTGQNGIPDGLKH